MMEEQRHVTQLLKDWQHGNELALNELMVIVHDSLHQQANSYMRRENPGHTLQATALVNETFLKLVDSDVTWQNRAHFLAIAARSMRQILVDHARAKKRDKRGGDQFIVTLHDTQIGGNEADPDLLDIEAALKKLAQLDERKANIVELSFYGGMTYDEIAEALGISVPTVVRELRFCKAWLKRRLSEPVT